MVIVDAEEEYIFDLRDHTRVELASLPNVDKKRILAAWFRELSRFVFIQINSCKIPVSDDACETGDFYPTTFVQTIVGSMSCVSDGCQGSGGHLVVEMLSWVSSSVDTILRCKTRLLTQASA